MLRRTRPLLIALTVLALSAGAALAARGLPATTSTTVDQPTHASESPDPSEGPEASEPEETQDQQSPEASGPTQTEGLESPDPSEGPDTQGPETLAPATSGPDAQVGGTAPDTHGAVVSEAAAGPTPAGWANHGAYVSAVARGLANPGDLAPDSTGRIKSGKPDATSSAQTRQHGKGPSH
jgi:hypothetical protein